jgi:plastocyanin
VSGSALVAIRDFAFQPNAITVKAGSSITWLNCEPAGTPSHTSTSNQAVWNSPLLAPGDAFTQTFNTPGTFPYICAVHPFMTGSITVE